MSHTTVDQINKKYMKPQVVDVHSGDTVRVHQKIREGNKERTQVFQGLVIRVDRGSSHTHRITVRRISSGVGVEKSFLLHSPLVLKVEVTKRSKVRRNYLSYMRALTGKATRLSGVDFDSQTVNTIPEIKPEVETEVEDISSEAINTEEPKESKETETKTESKNDRDSPETEPKQ